MCARFIQAMYIALLRRYCASFIVAAVWFSVFAYWKYYESPNETKSTINQYKCYSFQRIGCHIQYADYILPHAHIQPRLIWDFIKYCCFIYKVLSTFGCCCWFECNDSMVNICVISRFEWKKYSYHRAGRLGWQNCDKWMTWEWASCFISYLFLRIFLHNR